MPLFLHANQIKEAVSRLGASRAQVRLFDYLIFKRALVLSTVDGSSEEPRVKTGTNSPPFQQAIQEWAGVLPQGTATDTNPFFNPFGHKRDVTGGYRSIKYRSNGPSDTVNGWQGGEAPPFVFVRGTSPKAYTFEEISPDHMRRFLLTAPNDETAVGLPRLSDVAIWWLRSRDLELLDITAGADLNALIDVLIREVSLNGTERESIFESESFIPMDGIDISTNS